MPDETNVPMDELELYLYNYHNINVNNKISQSVSEQFDYEKTWYLVPFDPFVELVGDLYPGRVVHNESDFLAEEHRHPISNISITNSANICGCFSQPFIYQVKIDISTLLKRFKLSKSFWYASKIEILKAIPFWELLPPADSNFKGNIWFQDLKFIPEGLELPKLLKGDLQFWDSTLPKTIKLSEVIKGNLNFCYGIIPAEWATVFPSEVGNLRIGGTKLEKGTVLPKKVCGDIDFRKLTGFEEGVVMPESYLSVTAETVDFPADFKLLKTKLKTLTFEECNLPVNFEIPEVLYIRMHFTEKTIPVGLKLPESYTGILTFEACEISSELELSKKFDGHLVFKDMSLPSCLKLPDDFKGILEFRNVQIPEGFKFPLNIRGTLKISNSKIYGRLVLPTNDDYDFELNKESDMSDFDIPDAVLPRLIRLPSWHFER
jgi:hypothetical protein